VLDVRASGGSRTLEVKKLLGGGIDAKYRHAVFYSI